VVALGGNALTAEGQRGTHREQRENATAMARSIAELLDDGWRLAIVHGNGPQIGALSIQQEEGRLRVPEQPLFSLGAMTEGQLGSLVVLAMQASTRGRRPVAAVVTHTVVDPADPAFGRPTKPIGPFFTEVDARALAAERGWQVGEDAGRGYRRMVASPAPLGFVEIDAVRCLLDAGHVVVAAGGGGIPVVRRDGAWEGVEAVIDKDYAAAALAQALHAEALVLVTAVEAVMLDFGKPTQRRVPLLDAGQAERHLAAGQFPEGSMGPKVRAATRFLRGGGRVAVITTPPLAAATLASTDGDDASVGTRIVPTLRAQGGSA